MDQAAGSVPPRAKIAGMENEQLNRVAALLEIIADDLYVARVDRERELQNYSFNPTRDSLVATIRNQRSKLGS